jgi:hypothetical protein
MKQPRLTLVNCDDWQAFYVDGKCVFQHHEVDLVHWLKKLDLVKIDELWADNDPFLKENGRFPDEMRAVIPDSNEDLELVR